MHQLSDRRIEPRAPFHTVVGITRENGIERAGMTRNRSSHGLQFHSASEFARGERVELRISTPDSAEVRRYIGRVVRTHVESPEIGALLKHVTAVELDAPLDS